MAIGAGAGAIIGAGISAISGGLTSAFNVNAAREQRRWEERMANTAHQREIKDLKAAGLNPMLSGMGGSGAATPNVAAPQIDNPAKDVGGYVQSAVDFYNVTAPRLANETRATDALVQKESASARNIDQNTNESVINTQLKLAELARQPDVSESLRKKIEQQILDLELTKQQTKTSAAQEAGTRASTAQTMEQTKAMRAFVPFLTQGAKAISDLQAWLAKGEIGGALADTVEKIKKETGQTVDTIKTWGKIALELFGPHFRVPDYWKDQPKEKP